MVSIPMAVYESAPTLFDNVQYLGNFHFIEAPIVRHYHRLSEDDDYFFPITLDVSVGWWGVSTVHLKLVIVHFHDS